MTRNKFLSKIQNVISKTLFDEKLAIERIQLFGVMIGQMSEPSKELIKETKSGREGFENKNRHTLLRGPRSSRFGIFVHFWIFVFKVVVPKRRKQNQVLAKCSEKVRVTGIIQINISIVNTLDNCQTRKCFPHILKSDWLERCFASRNQISTSLIFFLFT